MSEVTESFEEFLSDVKKVPRAQMCAWMHSQWTGISKLDYFDPSKPYFVPGQLADVWKFLILYGRQRKHLGHFDPSRPLNRYKRFWSLAEAENKYADQPEFLTVFVFRLLCQQQSFLISPQRVEQAFRQTRAIYLEGEPKLPAAAFNVAGNFMSHFGLRLEDFLSLAESLYGYFKDGPVASKRDFASQVPPALHEKLGLALEILSADEAKYRDLHESASAVELNERPYEFNPSLRYPIFRSGQDYWCPFPELIVYAATRGLFFLLSDTFRSRFSRTFGELFSDYARRLTKSSLGSATVLSEADERQLGLEGKTNDITVIIQDVAVLIECKASALFSAAKRHATVEEIRADIRKNLVNVEKGKGLIQLYEKYRAIGAGELPPALAAKYQQVGRSFPVLLLYDRVQQANAPQTLRNLLLHELREAGIPEFPFQIWHIEELENLYELCGRAGFLEVVREKFDGTKYRYCDLNTLLFESTGRGYLRAYGFLPAGDTRAAQIIKQLTENRSATNGNPQTSSGATT